MEKRSESMALLVNKLFFQDLVLTYTPYFYPRNCFGRTLIENLAH